MADTTYLLEMLDVDKRFPGVLALDNAKLQLKAGTVHSLMGENGAGKSTLMKCLFGIYTKDKGEIIVEGQQVDYKNPKEALDNGVAMVHQELNQVLHRSVMENIWLGRFPTKLGLVDHDKMYKDTRGILEELNLDIDPKKIISELSVSQRQMVEIAKAVSYNAKIIVLDEPTSSLTSEEVNHLFTIIRHLEQDGVGIIYISHRMDEILEISDDVTIMRDGKWITTRPAAELDVDTIIRLMVDRDIAHRFPPKTNQPGEVVMRVENLTGLNQPTCNDVSFQLRKGEILGVSGLIGSRRTELVNTIFGYEKKASGEIYVDDKKVNNKTSGTAIRNGFALITEERRATGIFPQMNLIFNSVIANVDSYVKGPLLSSKEMVKDTAWVIENLDVKTPGQSAFIRNLSGGNQQKVIIGRWLLTDPTIFLMDEPTRGIDVGAKYEIYQLIIQLAEEGKSVIMVSSEMPELIGICDRILVMSNGQLSGILDLSEDHDGKEQEIIMHMATKYI